MNRGTGFKRKERRSELPLSLLKRLAEQGRIDPAEFGLTLPRRKAMKRVASEIDGVFYLTDRHSRLWPWPTHHMSEADFDETLLDWGYKLGGMLKAWHCRSPQESITGWPDWVYLFRGYHVISENKARDKKGDPPPVAKVQKSFLTVMALAGLTVRQFTHPDDTFDAWVMLTKRPVEDCPYFNETRPA